MKFEITASDKKLLIGLTIFVLVVCIGYWGIIPQIKKINETDKEIQVQKNLKAEIEQKLSAYNVEEMYNVKLKIELEGAKEGFFTNMENSDIDALFTTMLVSENHLSVQELGISEKKTVSIKPYKYSELSEEDVYAKENENIFSSKIYINATGKNQDIMNFIDCLAGMNRAVNVLEYNISVNELSEARLTLEAEIYMCEG